MQNFLLILRIYVDTLAANQDETTQIASWMCVAIVAVGHEAFEK